MAEKLSFAQRYATYSGKTLGSYYLERLSAEQETGPVFLARRTDTSTKQLYHLRFLALPAGLTSEDRLIFLGHFQREVSLVATLQHPAIIPLNDYGIFEGMPYLVSPQLSAHSLQSVVVGSGPLDPALVGSYLDKIADALEYAHRQGLLHLNPHAANILLHTGRDPLITEAGLLRLLAPPGHQPASLTARQATLENGSPLLRDQQGRPLYGLSLASAPAPELLIGRSPDTFTDVYALGALLYYLLTGHRAFRGKTLAEVADQHLQAPVPSLSAWRADLPAGLDNLLSSALNKNPARRLRTPGALANAYASVVAPGQGGRGIFVPSPAPVRRDEPLPALPPVNSADQPLAFSRRRAITLIAAGGGIALAAGVTALVVTHKGSSAAPIAGSGGSPSAPGATNSPGETSPTPGNSGNSTPPGHSGTVVARVSDMPPNSAKTFPLTNSNNPGVLVHLPNNNFVAFNSTCTHAGCAVAYSQQNHLLVCPCHDARFDPARNAEVVSGPAPTPLAPVPITVNSDGTITTQG